MKKNFTFFKSAMMLICALLFVQFSVAQRTTIAGWSFPSHGGPVSTYDANCGTGTLYLDGTHGSSEWTIVTSTNPNNNQATFGSGGATTNTSAQNACGVAGSSTDKALGLTGVTSNGKCVTFCVPTTGFQNIQLSYDMTRLSSGFTTSTWGYSTDGENFTDETVITDEQTASTFRSYTVDFSNATEINGQDLIYIRLTVDGATANNGKTSFDNILITGESDVPSAFQPEFNVQEGTYCGAIDVTLTCETPDASIYYTTDGTEPSNTNGTLYTNPVHIATTTTLRAVAYADGLAQSRESSATYTFPSSIATIAEFKALNGDDNYYKLACPVTAVFQSGNYLFVEDEAHTGLCIYNNSGFSTNYVNGDIITDGICGTNYIQINTTTGETSLQLKSPEFVNPVPTSGQEVEPVDVTISQLRVDWATYDSRLVAISGVTFEQGTFTTIGSTLNIRQGTVSLGCANIFGGLTGMTAPLATANVKGITFENTIAPRDVNDIVDLLSTITIVTPEEGQTIEEGDPVRVNLNIENFNFEDGSMIEGKLIVNGEPVTTQYLHSEMELSVFENMDLSTLMTEFGEYTIIVSLVNSDNTPFAIPASDTVHFTYQQAYIAIETSESNLEYTETGESHTFTVTAFRLGEDISVTVDNANFTVNPATLSATAENETVTVTFNGTESATGIVTLTSGTTTATVTLNAVIPIDELIHSVGFELSEGFTPPSQNVYNNDNSAYYGPEGQQWGVVHGCVTTTDAMVGQQSLQMRYYGTAGNGHLGHIGYTYTNYDIHNVTKVEFDAKSTGNLRLRASFSHNGGETFEGDSVFVVTSASQHFTYFITDSGEYYSVRVKFAVELPDPEPTSTVRLTIDAVDFYGVTGLEPNIVETPVISEPSGAYIQPITVNITCETEDARIYYTTDGTTPNENSALYENPITINSTCTLKAKAFKGGMDPSNVAFAEYSFPVEVANIAAFKAAGAIDNSVTYKITGNITFVYRNGRRIFVQDATGGLLVYDNNTPVVTGNYSEGNVINSGIIGTYTVYNGMQELIPSADWGNSIGTIAVTPEVTTAADITSNFANYEARLVRINAGVFTEEASFNTSDYTEATFTDGTGEIVFRNQFKTLDTIVNAGDSVDVIGLAAIYVTGGNTTYQLFPRTNADIIPIIPEPEDTTSTNPEDTVGIHTLDFINLTVYPNPTTDQITVSSDRDGGSLEVLNAFGQVVYRHTAPTYPMVIDLSDKAAGLYFVRIITANRRIAVVKIYKE